MLGLDFEEAVLRRFQLIEKRKAIKEEIELLDEEIEEQFKASATDGALVIQLPSGEWAVIKTKHKITEEYDREGLAEEAHIAMSELQKPIDVSRHTANGKLSPELIAKHIHSGLETKLKITKRKTKPRKQA